MQEFCKSLPGEDKTKFYDLFRESIATVSAYLGYDYMTDGYENIIVHNRGQLLIPESDARKFLKKSENYKDAFGSTVLVQSLDEKEC